LAGAGEESLDGFMIGLAVGLLPSAALCLPQIIGWSPLPAGIEPSGLFYNRDILGELSAPVFVWFMLRRSWLTLIPAVPLLLCSSRVSWVAASLGLIFALPGRVRKILGIAAMASVVAAVSVLWSERLRTVNERLMIWKITLRHVTISGHGIGSFDAVFPMFVTAHSDVLQAVFELGIGAAFLLALGIFLCLRETDRVVRGTFVASAVEVLVSFPLHLPANGFLVAVVAGHLARRRSAFGVGKSACRQGDGARSPLA
ncbi:MAG TPA: hypothetical protein VGR84_19045, partial [Candidatus Acidoferrales bacterium]|nr:hypothetical protein [Candidatus Acidoferrales bacterium]